MLDVFGFPTPQGANYQEFYGGRTGNTNTRDWIKPRGASMVRMLLIGAGGGGAGGSGTSGGGGGGSGAVTQWIGPAMFIPDVLSVAVGAGGRGGSSALGPDGVDGSKSEIIYQAKTGTGYTLLQANAGLGAIGTTGGTGAVANSNNFFGAAGIFKSVAGQSGANAANNITASTTTFLSGGAGGGNSSTAAGGYVAANYGYPTLAGGAGTSGGNGANGYFITQPILLGTGGSGGGGGTIPAGNGGNGGIGCGGGGSGTGSGGATQSGGRGGDGAVFIWSW